MDQKTPLFCPSCGAKTVRENQTFCEECGARLDGYRDSTAGVFDKAYESSTLMQTRPMKWYKFVVYFLLAFSAAANFISGITYISGRYVYGSSVLSSDYTLKFGYELYEEFPSLRILDIAYGAVLILFALYTLYVRGMLYRYKKDSPKLFLLYYAAGFVFSVIVNVGSTVIMGESLAALLPSLIISFIEIAVIFILNYVYFKKRSDMFVN